MRIGILGGTFDPVHRGHVLLARAAVMELGLDRFFFVPAKQSPFKLEKPAASGRHRLQMLRLALKRDLRMKISRFELDRPAPSFTIETLRHFKEKFSHSQLYFVLGSDSLAGFSGWRSWRQILKLCVLAVARRKGCPEPRLAPGIAARMVWLKTQLPEISSTSVRAGRTSAKLDRAVRTHLRRHRLYSAV